MTFSSKKNIMRRWSGGFCSANAHAYVYFEPILLSVCTILKRRRFRSVVTYRPSKSGRSCHAVTELKCWAYACARDLLSSTTCNTAALLGDHEQGNGKILWQTTWCLILKETRKSSVLEFLAIQINSVNSRIHSWHDFKPCHWVPHTYSSLPCLWVWRVEFEPEAWLSFPTREKEIIKILSEGKVSTPPPFFQLSMMSRGSSEKLRQVLKLHWFRSLCFNVPVRE